MKEDEKLIKIHAQRYAKYSLDAHTALWQMIVRIVLNMRTLIESLMNLV